MRVTQEPPAGGGPPPPHRRPLAALRAAGPAALAALLGLAGLTDAGRWCAWGMLAPLFAAPARSRWQWTLFGALLNGACLLPYRNALTLELVAPLDANLVYGGVVCAAVLPYLLLDVIARRWRPLPAPAAAAAVAGIWLATDSVLATKYWYALAMDQAPLWIVRHAGEEGLALGMVGTSLVLGTSLRLAGARRLLVAGAATAAVGWLCLGRPLEAPRAWPGADVVAVQLGPPARAAQPEAQRLLASLHATALQGWAPDLVVLPELDGIPLLDGDPRLAPFLRASRLLGAEILISGPRPADPPLAAVRVTGLLRDGALAPFTVPKLALVPYYESLRGRDGRRWVVGDRAAPRLLESRAGALAPLLCYEVFDRTALRGLARAPALVVVAADTTAFGDPALGRYVVHAAAFRGQAARAPVVLANYGGPSAVLFPDGGRARVFTRGEAGIFRIAPDGQVTPVRFAWPASAP